MPIVQGNLGYARSRIVNIVGISNIPIVIQDTTTGVGIVVLTDTNGNYVVNNVPAGSYRVVEAYGATGGVASPADFTGAAIIAVPTPKDPPLSAMPLPIIAGTNQVDSLSPNTANITVTTSTVTRNFIDSSIVNTPLSLPAGITYGSNILINAGNGIWGTLPAGTAAGTIPPTYPYSNSMVSSLLNYQTTMSGVYNVNTYTMVNINDSLWFTAPNHTTFDETSSYMVVNGGDPNALLFTETINVAANSFYLISAWLMMITDVPGTTVINFKVLGAGGAVLFNINTSNILYGQWTQIGSIFNTGANSSVTVQLFSQGAAVNGNDFALDDVALQPVDLGATTITKSVDKPVANVGDVLTYTIVVDTTAAATNLTFQDNIPAYTQFNPGTVTINGSSQSTYNPQTGFPLPNMAAGGKTTVTFQVTITSTPPTGQVDNTANLAYTITPITGNPVSDNISSNTATTTISQIPPEVIKSVDRVAAKVGDTLTYTIKITNPNSSSLTNVGFIDSIPNGTVYTANTFNQDGTPIPGSPDQTGIVLPNSIPGNGSSIVSFKVLIISMPNPNPIPNRATFTLTNLPSLQTNLVNTTVFDTTRGVAFI